MFISRHVFKGHTPTTALSPKKRQVFKTHANNSENKLEPTRNTQNLLKPIQITTKIKLKAAQNTWILSSRRPSDKDNDGHAPTQLRLARKHGTHDTHETKTKTIRSRSPGYGGRTSCSNSPKPPTKNISSWLSDNLDQPLVSEPGFSKLAFVC